LNGKSFKYEVNTHGISITSGSKAITLCNTINAMKKGILKEAGVCILELTWRNWGRTLSQNRKFPNMGTSSK